MAPMHPNCNCRTGVLDEAGNIAFFVEDLRDGKVPDFTRQKTQPQTRTLPQAPQVQKQQAPAQKGDEITELSESEALFIAKLQSIDVPFDKALEILYEMKRTNGKVPEEKFREWGFADKAGIAYVELQYKMIREGMTLEQYDYLESNASLSTATSIAITQLARAAMQKVRQRAIERQINAAKNEGTETASEGNNESTNKANAAKPDVQQGTAEGGTNIPDGRGVNNLPQTEAQLRHIFRNAKGHLPDTPTNRMLIENTANNPKNYLGIDSKGTSWYAQMQADGSQIWVQTYNGIITNAGLNEIPRIFNPQSGLNNNPLK